MNEDNPLFKSIADIKSSIEKVPKSLQTVDYRKELEKFGARVVDGEFHVKLIFAELFDKQAKLIKKADEDYSGESINDDLHNYVRDVEMSFRTVSKLIEVIGEGMSHALDVKADEMQEEDKFANLESQKETQEEFPIPTEEDNINQFDKLLSDVHVEPEEEDKDEN